MASALDATCGVLRLTDSRPSTEDVATRLLLARRIIRRAQYGESNGGRLLMVALGGLLSGEPSEGRKAMPV